MQFHFLYCPLVKRYILREHAYALDNVHIHFSMQLWPFFTWLTAVVVTLSALVSSSPPLRRFERQGTASRLTISKQQSDDVATWMDITTEQILSKLHSMIERHDPGRRLKRAGLDPEIAMLTPEEEAEEERIANRVYEKMRSDGLLDDSEIRPLIHSEMERYRIHATEHNCGFPALSRETWDKYDSASHLHTNLLEMVKARNDTSHPHYLHSKDIGAVSIHSLLRFLNKTYRQ